MAPLPAPSSVPPIRIQAVHEREPRGAGAYVLYWCTAFRRTGHNFALQRALDWCRELHRPLVVLEAVRIGYRWACDRFHRFLLDGMGINASRYRRAGILYLPYLEPGRGAGRRLLAQLASRACVVVTDDFPEFFHPLAVQAAAPQIPVRFEKVDSNGLFPMRATDRVFSTARSFRLHLQRHLGEHLEATPKADPLAGLRIPVLDRPPRGIASRWPLASQALLGGNGAHGLEHLPIDHRVGPVPGVGGGAQAGREALRRFLDERLDRYVCERNDPDADAASGLSPYLHFGHLSAHEILAALAAREGWTPRRLSTRALGGARGGWGFSENAEAFLDQLVTWRELGFNYCSHRDDVAELSSLPAWSLATLHEHARDRREAIYDLAELEAAQTHDPLWNAAQRQLVREGRIHNYLRMLWGKKVLEWTRSPQEALATLIELNNKYALDGRDPNSYSGILWIFGRYDRAWGPERPVFGKVRFMSSRATLRKVHLKRYLERFGPPKT
ncbi:MAG: deoxyribodipyrimidine photolyase [Deltaproteobacteria bacterium]|nr:deoxyribodipyrimidine photolyase [Deltaproteobacteria bacterium]